MKCPNCGAENLNTSRFCKDCGNKLPDQPPIQTYRVPQPKNPVADAGTVGSISSIIGGGLIVLGWLLPWFSLGSLLGSVLRSFGAGGLGLDFTRGIGSGLQIFFGLIVASFAAFGDSDTAFLGLLGLILAAVLILIPIWGVLIVKTGIKVYELRANASNDYSMNNHLQRSRKRSGTIFVILLIIFILVSMIPFVGTSVLGGSFWLMVLSAIGVFAGAFYAQNKLRMSNP